MPQTKAALEKHIQ